jgi:hypothetical protein
VTYCFAKTQQFLPLFQLLPSPLLPHCNLPRSEIRYLEELGLDLVLIVHGCQPLLSRLLIVWQIDRKMLQVIVLDQSKASAAYPLGLGLLFILLVTLNK